MEQDIYEINRFMTQNLSPTGACGGCVWTTRPRYIPLPSGATGTIFPHLRHAGGAGRPRAVLAAALDVTVRRFRPLPYGCGGVCSGTIWRRYPTRRPYRTKRAARWPMRRSARCGSAPSGCWCIDRFAVEFFHALTDGTGALVFVKSLLAEYLSEKYGISVPAEKGRTGTVRGAVAGGTGGQLCPVCWGCDRQPRRGHGLAPDRHTGDRWLYTW